MPSQFSISEDTAIQIGVGEGEPVISAGIHIYVGQKRVSESLGTGVTGTHLTWMLGTELRSYGRTAMLLTTDPSPQSLQMY